MAQPPGGLSFLLGKLSDPSIGRLVIAGLVVAAYLASDYASFINGVVIPVDGGIEAMLATTPV